MAGFSETRKIRRARLGLARLNSLLNDVGNRQDFSRVVSDLQNVECEKFVKEIRGMDVADIVRNSAFINRVGKNYVG
jgi:hypothetical protein